MINFVWQDNSEQYSIVIETLLWESIEVTSNLVEATRVLNEVMSRFPELKPWTVEIQALPNGLPEITIKKRVIH